MNVEFINPFVNAAMNVLETMAFVKPKVGKPYKLLFSPFHHEAVTLKVFSKRISESEWLTFS